MNYKFGDRIRRFQFTINKIIVAEVREYTGYGLSYMPTKQRYTFHVNLHLPFKEKCIQCTSIGDARSKLKNYLGERAWACVKEVMTMDANEIKDVEVND